MEDEVGKQRELDLQNVKKLMRSEHFWKMRPAKCVPACSESSISHENCKKQGGSSAARTLVDLVRRSWQAGLQLEVAKRIAAAARTVVFDHSATLLLFGIATGGC